jgi:excisionase family DNA binding protein
VPESFLTVREAAQVLRVSAQTLRRWVHAGRMDAIQPGRDILIPAHEVERLMTRRPVSR